MVSKQTTRISVPKKEQRPGTPKVRSQYRANFVTHEGAKIMLEVYKMADDAGLTWMELTDILAEETHRRISKMTWRNGKRRTNLKGVQ
jgi:hypothetical protein